MASEALEEEFSLKVNGDDWTARRFPACVEVYDCDGHPMLRIPGQGHSVQLVQAVAVIHEQGYNKGKAAGRAILQSEYRRLMGVQEAQS